MKTITSKTIPYFISLKEQIKENWSLFLYSYYFLIVGIFIFSLLVTLLGQSRRKGEGAEEGRRTEITEERKEWYIIPTLTFLCHCVTDVTLSMELATNQTFDNGTDKQGIEKHEYKRMEGMYTFTNIWTGPWDNRHGGADGNKQEIKWTCKGKK